MQIASVCRDFLAASRN